MTGQLFYAWPYEDADADAKAAGEEVIARLRSEGVVIRAVEGGYSVSVAGFSFKESAIEARRLAAELQNQGGFHVGRNFPARSAPPPSPAPMPAPPPYKLPIAKRPQPGQPAVSLRRSPVATSAEADAITTAGVLVFMQTTYMHEPTLNFLRNRLNIGMSELKRSLQALVDQGLVDRLSPRAYRLTEAGRQASRPTETR